MVHQLLDFMYGYVSGVLQDAEVNFTVDIRTPLAFRMTPARQQLLPPASSAED